MIISNKLSVSDVGIFYSIMGFITIIALYHDLGLTEALQYFLPQYRIQKEYHKIKTITIVTRVCQFVFGALIAGIIYLSSDRLALHYFHVPNVGPTLRLFCLYFFGINFVQTFMTFFISFQDTFNQNLIDFIKNYTTLGFTIFFRLTNTLTLGSFSRARLLGIFVSIGAGIRIFMRKYQPILAKGTFQRDKSLLRKQLGYAFRVFLGTNA